METLILIKTKPLIQDKPSNIEHIDDDHVWRTADNRKIKVKNMTTAHINNCIKCWNGQGNMNIPIDYLGGKDKWLNIFQTELTNRQAYNKQ